MMQKMEQHFFVFVKTLAAAGGTHFNLPEKDCLR